MEKKINTRYTSWDVMKTNDINEVQDITTMARISETDKHKLPSNEETAHTLDPVERRYANYIVEHFWRHV